MNSNVLRDFAKEAEVMIKLGYTEDVLRHHLTSKLPLIFPDDPWWIKAHISGTEAHVQYLSDNTNKVRHGFVDALVGKTAIEYEKNLMRKEIFDEGYMQVKEYCAALCSLGVPEKEVLGVLSDTVRWYGYSVRIIGAPRKDNLFGPNDIELNLIDEVNLSNSSDDKELYKFEQFIRRFLERKNSRFLTAETLAEDFGISSSFYIDKISNFRDAVRQAVTEKPDYARLVADLWQNFIAYLGISDYGSFSVKTYVNEFYLVTLAKFICVNIIEGRSVIRNYDELKDILTGSYFKAKNITNLVDYDYFGWLNEEPYVQHILQSVDDLQKKLEIYDFSLIDSGDVFGKLLAQLADKEHRLMLGQEFTPHWVAHDIAEEVVNRLPSLEYPRILDMCCGSGVFLIEAIKTVRKKFEIEADLNYNEELDKIAFSCVMGFDIDPLAVMLAKVNWILAMRDLFSLHKGEITIPVYQADSLFIETPIIKLPQNNDCYSICFEHHRLIFPDFILSPLFRNFFDSFTAKVYRLAMTRAKAKNRTRLCTQIIENLLQSVKDENRIDISAEKNTMLIKAAYELVLELEDLQRSGKNGIWYFILSNSYRPGLSEKQFNCIISNPPWMALSKLAVNPYKTALTSLAEEFGIMPPGSSHPHIELSTIFLLRAVDRYLTDGGVWSCVMPASILSGYNHENLRKEEYRNSSKKVSLTVDAIWELPISTFKNKAIVLSGKKSACKNSNCINGRIYSSEGCYSQKEYFLRNFGKRSTWTSNVKGDLANSLTGGINFLQGCDLMPRSALFHDFQNNNGFEIDLYPIKPHSNLCYLLCDQKISCCPNLSAKKFNLRYVYHAFISKHLSPFILSQPVPVLLPAKNENGTWEALTNEDLALSQSTENVFNRLLKDPNTPDSLEDFFDKINIRNKLSNQNFSQNQKMFLVLSNAGGSKPCAAFIDISSLDVGEYYFARDRLVIDQTLYWYTTNCYHEAVFITGLINSDAMSEAIKDFQPDGGFGKRHIHTLPYKLIPNFDSENAGHAAVISATSSLIEEWQKKCQEPEYAKLLVPNSGSLNHRRKMQQNAIKELPSYANYESSCKQLLM